MKKLKLFKPLMVVPVAATPLCVLASCGGDEYISIASDLKEETLDIFRNVICPTHRSTWDCGEAAQAIKDFMEDEAELPITGWDEWSQIKDVITIGKETLTRDIYPDTWDGKLFSGENPDYGNMWYDIPAYPESRKTDPKIVLQSHYDMPITFTPKTWAVWSKKSTKGGGIQPFNDIENEILTVQENSPCLGADNGLGIALMLAIANNRFKFEHGPIRLLFNVDESASVEDTYVFEDGEERNEDIVAGADLLRYDQWYNQYPSPAAVLKGCDIESHSHAGVVGGDPYPFGKNYEWSNILSLDGIVKGRIYQSSAGIHDCSMSDDLYQTSEIEGQTIENLTLIAGASGNAAISTPDNPVYKVKVSGLHGGYSSEDINKGYANALQILMRLITDDSVDYPSQGNITKYGFHLLSVHVPTGASNIPSSATAFFTTSKVGEEPFDTPLKFLQEKARIFTNMVKDNYPNEKGLQIEVKEGTDITHWGDDDDERKIIENITSKVQAILNTERSAELCQYFSFLLYGPMTYFDKSFKEVKTSQSFGPLNIDMLLDEGDPVDPQDDKPECNIGFRIIIRSADPSERFVFSEFAHFYAKRMLAWINDISADIEDAILPIWEYDANDKLVDLATEAYGKLGYKPEVTNLHGWAEIASYPRIWEEDPVEPQGYRPYITCIGPTITDIHEADESVWTDTMVSWIRAVLYIMDHDDKLGRYENQ